jgi:hypothetical protein
VFRRAWLTGFIAVIFVLVLGGSATRALPGYGVYAQPIGQEPDLQGARGPTAAGAIDGLIGYNLKIQNDMGLVEMEPAVAYNSQRGEYLVVWYNDRPGNDDIQAQRVSKDGALLGGPFYIDAGPGADRRHPDVAYDSAADEYLVVWEHFDQATTSFSIHGRRISATGNGITNEFPIFDFDHNETPAVAYASTADQYLIVWMWAESGMVHIAGRTFSTTGGLGGTFLISEDTTGNPRSHPDLAYNSRRNEYLVAWQQVSGPGDLDIYARRVNAGGTPLQPAAIEITTTAEDQNLPAVGAIPTVGSEGQYLVVWENPYPGGSLAHTYARLVDGSGSTLGGEFYVGALNSFDNDQVHPAVAGNARSKQYLVAWKQPTDPPLALEVIHARAVSSDGDLVDDEFSVGGLSADRPAVANGPSGDFLIAFDGPALTGSRGIYGQLVGNRIYLPLLLR